MIYKCNATMRSLITKSVEINIMENQHDLMRTYCLNNKFKNIKILEEYLMTNHKINIGSLDPERMNHLFNSTSIINTIQLFNHNISKYGVATMAI